LVSVTHGDGATRRRLVAPLPWADLWSPHSGLLGHITRSAPFGAVGSFHSKRPSRGCWVISLEAPHSGLLGPITRNAALGAVGAYHAKRPLRGSLAISLEAPRSGPKILILPCLPGWHYSSPAACLLRGARCGFETKQNTRGIASRSA
jgi:hypothetical protein